MRRVGITGTLVGGKILVPVMVRKVLDRPSVFPRPQPQEYHENALHRLDDLASWFFFGHRPYEEGRGFDPLEEPTSTEPSNHLTLSPFPEHLPREPLMAVRAAPTGDNRRRSNQQLQVLWGQTVS